MWLFIWKLNIVSSQLKLVEIDFIQPFCFSRRRRNFGRHFRLVSMFSAVRIWSNHGRKSFTLMYTTSQTQTSSGLKQTYFLKKQEDSDAKFFEFFVVLCEWSSFKPTAITSHAIYQCCNEWRLPSHIIIGICLFSHYCDLILAEQIGKGYFLM